jgi:hypothetical protein
VAGKTGRGCTKDDASGFQVRFVQLEGILFEDLLQLLIDEFHGVQLDHLLVPRAQVLQMLRQVALVGAVHLIELASNYNVNPGQFLASQERIFAMLGLLAKLRVQDFQEAGVLITVAHLHLELAEILAHTLLARLRAELLGLHRVDLLEGGPADELSCVRTEVSVEVVLEGHEVLPLRLRVEESLRLLLTVKEHLHEKFALADDLEVVEEQHRH